MGHPVGGFPLSFTASFLCSYERPDQDTMHMH